MSLLGFSQVVAPINQTASAKKSLPVDSTVLGDVEQLQGGKDAPPPVAPSLYHLVRQMLEEQEMSTESVQNYLGKVNSWGRYQSAFNLLWQKLQLTEESWRSLSLSQVASALISLHMQSPCQARNAYSAALLVPGFSQLRFLPVLQPYKRQWNSSVEKYATFWSPLSLLQQLVAEPLGTNPTIVALRDRLLICCRLLLLHRSID
jgi:hypothetical protein